MWWKTILKLLCIIAIFCTTKFLVHYLHLLQDEIILHISITAKFILWCRIYFPTAWNHSSWGCSQNPVLHKNLVKLGLSFWSKHGSKMCIRSSTHFFSRRTVSFLEFMSRCVLHLILAATSVLAHTFVNHEPAGCEDSSNIWLTCRS